MAMDVTLTAAMRSNLLTLQNTTSNIGKIQNILATGKSVNSALDDPTAFFASQSLLNRADDLSALLDSMGQSIQVLQAADDGISSITTMVEQMKSVAQSAKDGASGSAYTTLYTKDISAANMSDAAAALGATLDANADFVVTTATGGAENLVSAANDDVFQYAAKINALTGVNAEVVEGETEGTYRIKITAATEGETITVTDGDTSVAPAGLGLYSYASDGTTHTAVTTAVAVEPSTGAPTDRTTLEASYNDLITQLNQLVGDAGYRGTNLLNGNDLSTTFNEDGTSSYTVSGKSYKTTDVGTRLAISAADFGSLTTIEAAIDQIDAALSNLRADAKSFGNSLAVIQTRSDFTENLIANLQEGSDKLVLADTNEEGAKLLSLQTSQQLGIQALSLAAQSQQSVLQLFQ